MLCVQCVGMQFIFPSFMTVVLADVKAFLPHLLEANKALQQNPGSHSIEEEEEEEENEEGSKRHIVMVNNSVCHVTII